jgi:trimeric autotransporter adhesin
MRQLAIICCLVGTFVLWGCGGHKKAATTPPAKVTFDVPGISLTFGEIFTIPAASVHVVDASGNVLTNSPTFTVSSANTNLVTINSANNAEICGGIFNANVTVCNPKDGSGNFLTAGSTTITISAQGVNSDPIPVSVHPRVSSAIVVSPSNSCVSQNQTSAAYTVVACSAGTAPACTGGTNIANTLGTITWSTSDSTIATVDSNGIVTSKLPGAVNVTATLGNVNVVNPTAALFVACPPKTISIHVTAVPDTTFSLNPSDPTTPTTTVKLDADVMDTATPPQPITGAALTWSSFTPASATVGTDGTVTAVAAGTTSVVASCTPPTCNPAPALSPQQVPAGTGSPVFSNLVTGSVAGTSAPAVYATAPVQTDGATANMVLLTIDPANPGTPQSVTLPHPANSMVFDRQGLKAYLGTADGHGIMQFDPNNPTAAPTVIGDGTITGTVIGVSRDGSRVVVSDTSASPNKDYVVNVSNNNSIETFSQSGITGADFALDNSKGLFSSPTPGNSLFYIPGGTRAIAPVGNDVKFLPQGSVAYFGGASINGVSSCSTSTAVKTVDSQPNAVNVWGVATDGTHLIGAGGGNWVDLSPTADPRAVPLVPCPTAFGSTVRTTALPAFVGTPSQIVVTPNSKKALMTGFTVAQGQTVTGIPLYDFALGTGSVVAGISSPALSGGISLDGNTLYIGVGGSAPGVYKVDLTAATPSASLLLDTTPSPNAFVPSIVTVRPK